MEVCLFIFLGPDHYAYELNSFGIVMFSKHRARDFCPFLDNSVYNVKVTLSYSLDCIRSNGHTNLEQVNIDQMEHI